MDSSAQCMRPLSQPETVLSAIAQIGPTGAQTPAHTSTGDHPEKHADPPQLSSQSRLFTVQQPHLHIFPSLPTSTSVELSLLAANSRPDERPSGTLAIAAEFTTMAASVSELAIPADERSDMLAPLRTWPSTSPSPTPGIAKTYDCFGPSGILVSSSSTVQSHIPLSVDLDLCAPVFADSEQADGSSDYSGTRQMHLDPMPSVSLVVQSNFSHATVVTAPRTLGTLPASETDNDSAIGTIDCGHMSPATPCLCSTLLPLDVRPPHSAAHNGLSVLNVSSGAAHGLLSPRMPDDPITEDQMPPSGRLLPSSLPASQVSDLSLAADHVDILSASDTEHSGSRDGPAIVDLGSNGTEDSASNAQVPVTAGVLALDTYSITEGPCLTLGTSAGEDMAPELPASSPPSSSPPCLFSSPTRSFSGSPPSSSPMGPPCDVEGHLRTPTIQGDIPANRRMVDESCDTAASSSLECRPLKRMKTELPATLPNPARPTQASQAKQRKKLAAPFRSPIIKGPLVQGGLHIVYASGRTAASATASKPPAEKDATDVDAMVESNIHVTNKDRTSRAAKQFKPPMQVANAVALSQSSSTIAASAVSRVGAASTIQALQGQVQTLKQAIKIKHSDNGDDDEVLEQLVEKWTAVGREVAWALWDHVKDLGSGTGAPPQGGGYADEDDRARLKRGFDSGWAYDDDEHARKKVRIDEDVEQGEFPVVQHTVGVMLRGLGIDPDTLGWNGDEGDFVDV